VSWMEGPGLYRKGVAVDNLLSSKGQWASKGERRFSASLSSSLTRDLQVAADAFAKKHPRYNYSTCNCTHFCVGVISDLFEKTFLSSFGKLPRDGNYKALIPAAAWQLGQVAQVGFGDQHSVSVFAPKTAVGAQNYKSHLAWDDAVSMRVLSEADRVPPEVPIFSLQVDASQEELFEMGYTFSQEVDEKLEELCETGSVLQMCRFFCF